jgi:hypothetical protein
MPDILDMLQADHSPATGDMRDVVAPSMAADPFSVDEYSITPLDEMEDMRPKARVRLHPKASWLDALLPQQVLRADSVEPPKASISSVNSDDNGLYRMFVGVSP